MRPGYGRISPINNPGPCTAGRYAVIGTRRRPITRIKAIHIKNRNGNHESPDTRYPFPADLPCCAVITATLAIFQSSVFWTLVYLVGILLSCLVIIYSFCTKCPCRKTDCGHVIPGKLTRFFPPARKGLTPSWDKTGVVVPIVFVIVFPQYWLLSHPLYSVVFAVLCLIAAADIQFFVCKGCTNCFCPFFQGECKTE